MQGAQVEQDVDQSVEVSDGLLVAQLGPLNAQVDGLTVDALGGGALVVDVLVQLTVAVDLVAQTSPNASCQRGDASPIGPTRVVHGTGGSRGLGIEQRTGVARLLARDRSGATEESVFERHRERGVAKGEPVGVESARGTAFGPRNSSKASLPGLPVLMEVFIDVEGVKGGVEGAETRTEAQAAFSLGHQRCKVADIGGVKGLGEFGEDDFGPTGELGGDDTRGVAPVVLADGHTFRGTRIGTGRGGFVRGRGFLAAGALVVLPLTAKFAVRIARGLLGLVKAVGDEGLGIVLLDPGENVFGVQGDSLPKVVCDIR